MIAHCKTELYNEHCIYWLNFSVYRGENKLFLGGVEKWDKIERRHFVLDNNMNVFDKKGQAVQIESNVVFLYLH